MNFEVKPEELELEKFLYERSKRNGQKYNRKEWIARFEEGIHWIDFIHKLFIENKK